ncbi:MAG: ATP-dependent DNA helicase, partial [bacterium]
DYAKAALGLEPAETALIPSPFDYKQQAIMYIPEGMPEPNSEAYAKAVTEQVESLLRITGGRTMVLFTSYALLFEVADMVNTDCRLLKQGERDTFVLLEEFRQDPAAVLFGTYSFWQGIDLQGDCLKCVVITKLPFAVPTEPVIEARMERMLSHGEDPFREYQVPNAVMLFRQGFGRLIRSQGDRGVIAVLDTRIISKSYGRVFLSSLPEIEITADLKRVSSFYKEIDSPE